MICRCSRDTCDSASVNKNATNLRKIHGRHGHHRRYTLKKKHSLYRNFNLKSSLNLRNTRICTKRSPVRTLRDRLRILPTNTLVREASKCMRKIGVPAFHPYLRSLMQRRRCHASPTVRNLRDRLRILPANTSVREANKCIRKIGLLAFHPCLRSRMQLRRCRASLMLGVAIFCLGSYASDVTLVLVFLPRCVCVRG